MLCQETNLARQAMRDGTSAAVGCTLAGLPGWLARSASTVSNNAGYSRWRRRNGAAAAGRPAGGGLSHVAATRPAARKQRLTLCVINTGLPIWYGGFCQQQNVGWTQSSHFTTSEPISRFKASLKRVKGCLGLLLFGTLHHC